MYVWMHGCVYMQICMRYQRVSGTPGMYVRTHACMHACKHKQHMHMQARAAHACIYGHVQTIISIMHAYTGMGKQSPAYACIYIYIYIWAWTSTHQHMHAYTGIFNHSPRHGHEQVVLSKVNDSPARNFLSRCSRVVLAYTLNLAASLVGLRELGN